jgi:hypothetical protein
MDEEEIKKIQAKLVYLKESGEHYKAFKLNEKLKKGIAKAKYNKTIGKENKPSFFKSILKKSKEALVTVASDVVDGVPDVVEKAKNLITAEKDKIESIVKGDKEQNPNVPVEEETPQDLTGTTLSNIDNVKPINKPEREVDPDEFKEEPEEKTTTTTSTNSISGTYGLAYGEDGKKGVGSVTIGDKKYMPGDEGFEDAEKQFLESIKGRETVEDKIKRIKKNKK